MLLLTCRIFWFGRLKKSSLVCYCLNEQHAELVNLHVDMCMFDDQHDAWIKHELYIYIYILPIVFIMHVT